MMTRKPLFIYDCDGTLQGAKLMVYALFRAKMNMSLEEFQKKHENDKNALFPGMGDLIRYTAQIGNNVLLSGGDPKNDAASDLKDLFKYFTNWKCDGKDVPFGQEPEGYAKQDPKLAQALRKAFCPSMIVVIGNEETEALLAKHIGADAFVLKGKDQAILDKAERVPIRVTCPDTMQAVGQMRSILQQRMNIRKATTSLFLQRIA